MPGWVLCIGVEFACIAGVYPDEGICSAGGCQPFRRTRVHACPAVARAATVAVAVAVALAVAVAVALAVAVAVAVVFDVNPR